jgi:hypothetical protein
MKQLTIFRILTFILLPIAAVLGLLDVILIFSALANPAFLLVAFISGSFVIYTFVSLQFLTKNLETGRPAKPSVRDWIRVNAFVSLFMGVMFLMNSVSIFAMSDLSLRQFVMQYLEAQPNIPAKLNIEMFVSIMRGASYFLFFFSIILLAHIRINFRQLKKNAHLFGPPKAQ